MKTVLEFILAGKVMLVMNEPPMCAQLGDITVGPDGQMYRIVQRAFLIEKPTAITLRNGKNQEGRVRIQCVIIPVEEDEVVNAE